MYYNSRSELIENTISAMHDISKRNKGPAESLLEPPHEKENKHKFLPAIVIDIHEKDNSFVIEGLGDVNNLSADQIQYANDLVDAVFQIDSNEGVVEEYNMRFMRVFSPHSERIILIDKSYEDDMLSQLNISFIISFSVAFCLFTIISIFISGYIVKPVEKSINQQKQLIADMSHELKTPITVVSTNTDILLSHQSSTVADENKWLGYIKDETGRMSEIINSMLYLAKADESDEKPKLTEVNLSNVVYATALSFESVCFEKNKTLNINVTPDLKIMADEPSIKQLLFILLDNAVKYSNDSGTISVNVESHSDKVNLSVFNTGDPIPQESLPYLFERFYRIDKARSRENGGSGLGLSIAKKIAENNDSSIAVISNNNGNTFKCSFKLIKSKNK